MNESLINDRASLYLSIDHKQIEGPPRVFVMVTLRGKEDDKDSSEIKSTQFVTSFESIHNPFVVEDGITSLLLPISDVFENIENILKDTGIIIDRTQKLFKHQTEVHLFPNGFQVWGHIEKSEINVPLIAPDRKPPLSLLQNLGGYVTERIVRYLSPEGENH